MQFVFYFYNSAISLLRKYYNILWQSFSDDHILTIGILDTLIEVKESFFDEVVAITNPSQANIKILDALILWLKQDDKIMEFCKVIKRLAMSNKFVKELLQFELGMNTDSCAYMYIGDLYVLNKPTYCMHCNMCYTEKNYVCFNCHSTQ